MTPLLLLREYQGVENRRRQWQVRAQLTLHACAPDLDRPALGVEYDHLVVGQDFDKPIKPGFADRIVDLVYGCRVLGHGHTAGGVFAAGGTATRFVPAKEVVASVPLIHIPAFAGPMLTNLWLASLLQMGVSIVLPTL